MLHQYLDASTAYVTQLEARDFASAPCFVSDYTYGAFFYVSSDPEGFSLAEWEAYPNIKAVLDYARTQGCSIVRFDADGDDDLPLPRFSW